MKARKMALGATGGGDRKTRAGRVRFADVFMRSNQARRASFMDL
jgi:hypothetical protein